MNSQNGNEDPKIQTPRTWTDKEKRRTSAYTGCVKRFGQDGRANECQPLAPSRDDRAGGNSCITPGEIFTGGIIQQLIDDINSELKALNDRQDVLSSRLSLLTQLLNSLYAQNS
jgi:hypothetical protein